MYVVLLLQSFVSILWNWRNIIYTVFKSTCENGYIILINNRKYVSECSFHLDQKGPTEKFGITVTTLFTSFNAQKVTNVNCEYEKKLTKSKNHWYDQQTNGRYQK